MESFLRQFQKRLPWIYFLLMTPLSWIYWLVIKSRNLAYTCGLMRVNKLSQPVISVGNIEVGGTGKTPWVIYICRELIARGERPAILARGYRSGLKRSENAYVLNGRVCGKNVRTSTVIKRELHPDEAMLQSMSLPDVPVVLGSDRFRAAQWFLCLRTEPEPTVWIMDDGFQHRKLVRDLDIVLLGLYVEKSQLNLLPRSILREPVSSLARAHVIVHRRNVEIGLFPRVLSFLNKAPYLIAYDTITTALQPISEAAFAEGGQQLSKVNVVTAIANPQRVMQSVQHQGIKVAEFLIFPDHELIKQSDLSRLDENVPVVISEKDYFRQPAFWRTSSYKVYLLPLQLQIDVEARTTLASALSKVIKSK